MRSASGLVLATLLTVGIAASGCSAPAADDGRLSVVASFYPLQYAAQRVAGDRATVVNLVKPGVEPHDVELSPRQAAQVGQADLLVYLKGFQPAVDEAADHYVTDRRRVLDVSALGSQKPAADPHVWLDPVRYAGIAKSLAVRLAEIDPAHAKAYMQRAARLVDDLDRLDAEYAKGLATCQRRELVVSHAAFGHLATRYHLEQIPIAGLSPDQEPTPKRLAELADLARRHHVTVIFFETLASDAVAKTLAEQVGARTAVLDPLEGLKPGSRADYFSVMRDNLAAIRSALGCS